MFKTFSGCKNIESVIVGSGIQIIGDGAFAGIDRLKDFVCWATELPFLRGDRSTFYNTDRTNATLHVPFKSIQKYKRNMYDWGKFKSIIAIEGTQPSHTITYYVDGEVYKTIEVYVEDVVNPEADLVKEGYTFSGWSEIPKTMPDHDVTVTGTFTINKYKLTYMVDGEEYKSYEIKYGSTIIPIDELTKEGYSFSGWSEIPEEMPAHDLTITGTFTKNPLGTCAAPTISIVGDKLTFGCETEGVTYHYKISCSYEKSGEGNSVELQAVYKVTVYASKDDYVNSETVTMEVIGTGTGGILGDLTGDGKVNVADHVKLSDIIMKQSK